MSALASTVQAQFHERGDALAGHDDPAVRALRERAFAKFESVGLPNLKVEDWKYTDVRAIREQAYFAVPQESDESFDFSGLDLARFDGPTAVFVNGQFDAKHSSLDSAPTGVTLNELRNSLDQADGDVLRYLESDHDGAFAALNSAFVSEGLVIRVGANTNCVEPLHVVFVNSERSNDQMRTTRLIVVAEDNSRCRVVETHCGLVDTQGLSNHVTSLHANTGANIAHTRVQVEAETAHHIGKVSLTVEKDATINTVSFAFGGALTRVDIVADLVGSGAHASLDGLFIANDAQHIDHHTWINHQVGRTTSSENYKGIADGNGRGVFNGKIYVATDAQKIEAVQSSKNLLLSELAEIDTKPELEIYADDVKCAHGATVGQLDEDAYFYLRSRGIDKATARSLLTFAFAADIASGVDVTELREWLEREILARTHTEGVNELDSNE